MMGHCDEILIPPDDYEEDEEFLEKERRLKEVGL